MSQAETTQNQPIAKFRYGGVSAAVFVNRVQRADGSAFEVKRTVLQRTYVDEAGQYKTTSSFDTRDLPRAVLALQKAFEFCVSAREQGEDDES